MKFGNIFKAVEKHTPPVLIGFAVYSGLKFTLEVLGVISLSLTPFDTLSVLSIGFLFMFEKHVRINYLLAFAPAVIALSFCHDFFGMFLGTEGFTGDVVMGLSVLIGFCIYFIHFFMRGNTEYQGESPLNEGGKFSLYLDEANKYFIPAELLKYHTEVIGIFRNGKNKYLQLHD